MSFQLSGQIGQIGLIWADLGSDETVLQTDSNFPSKGQSFISIFNNATTPPIQNAVVRPYHHQAGKQPSNQQPNDVVGVVSWGSLYQQQLSNGESDKDPYYMDVSSF